MNMTKNTFKALTKKKKYRKTFKTKHAQTCII